MNTLAKKKGVVSLRVSVSYHLLVIYCCLHMNVLPEAVTNVNFLVLVYQMLTTKKSLFSS